jgi:hypothetical protein
VPGHSIEVSATVPYGGSVLTQEEQQAVADAAARAAKEAVEGFGKTVPSEGVEGIIIQGAS